MAIDSGDRKLHFVFPQEARLREVFSAMKFASQSYETPNGSRITIWTESNFDRKVIDNEESMVVFMGEIPSWMPLKTSAMICLYFMNYVVDTVHDNEEEYRIFQKWKRNARRADVVFARSDEQRNLLGRYIANRIITAPPAFYHPKIHGEPDFEVVGYNQMKKTGGIITYGPLCLRQQRLADKLQKVLGNSNTYKYSGPLMGEDRKRALIPAKGALCFRRCELDKTIDPTFVSEMLGTEAFMAIESPIQTCIDDGLNGDSFVFFRDIEDTTMNIAESLMHYATRGIDCYKMAKRCFQRYSENHSVNRFFREIYRICY